MSESDWKISESRSQSQTQSSYSVSVEETTMSSGHQDSSFAYNDQYSRKMESPSAYVPSQQEFQFVTHVSDVSAPPLSPSGTLSSSSGRSGNDSGNVRQKGTTGGFLDNRGFGWLMEVEDDDENEEKKPLLEELDIDIQDIYHKVRAVVLPLPQMGFDSKIIRDNPDFWGPLVVVLLYSLVSIYGQFGVVSWILTIWIVGSALVFLLARVLGGEVYYAQCLGVIGYCLLPLTIIALILPLFSQMHYVGLFFKLLGVLWATYSASSLLCFEELRQKRSLLLYPIFLLYIYFLSLYTGA